MSGEGEGKVVCVTILLGGEQSVLPPMNSPYGRLALPWIGYTSFTYFSAANSVVKITPHVPHPPWSCAASKGSSNFTFSASILQPISTSVATNPQTTAAHGSTTEQPAVMAAKPPRSPLQTSKYLDMLLHGLLNFCFTVRSLSHLSLF